MKRSRLVVFALFVLIVFLQGCYTMHQVGTTSNAGIEITNMEKASSMGQFSSKKWVHHFIFGLVSPADTGVEKLISEAVRSKGGTRAVNVKMKYQMSFVNGLLSFITFTLYSPFGVIILALTSVNKATVRSSSRRLQIRQRAFGRSSNFTSQYVRRFRKVNLGWR